MPAADDWVSASEIGAYTYCARAYWLDRVQHVNPSTESGGRLQAGQARHLAHGRRVLLQRWLVLAGVSVLIAAVGLVWMAIG